MVVNRNAQSLLLPSLVKIVKAAGLGCHAACEQLDNFVAELQILTVMTCFSNRATWKQRLYLPAEKSRNGAFNARENIRERECTALVSLLASEQLEQLASHD